MSILVGFSIECRSEGRSASGPLDSSARHEIVKKRNRASNRSETNNESIDFKSISQLNFEHTIKPQRAKTRAQDRTVKNEKKSTAKNAAISVIVVNCRSLRNKVAELHHLVGSSGASVIIGTESWLTDDISDSEVFPKGFDIYRKDRWNRSGGGVFIAVKNTIASQAVTLPDSEIESVWCSFRCSKSRKVYVCSYYRPPDTDAHSIFELERQIMNITSKDSGVNLIIGGDFNAPSVDWRTYSYIPGGRDREVCEALVGMFTLNCLEQLATTANRGENILDLLATNIPDKVINVDTMDGISDHRVVTA